MGSLARGLAPFYLVMALVALLVALVPEISLFLPDLLMPVAK
jgi:TRAP-type C4-dicarboxylate transport system permease large subunit